MSFRLSKQEENFGKQLRDGNKPFFKMDFDTYYICAMVGLVTGTKETEKIDSKNSRELLRNYPIDYRDDFRIINGLLVSSHLKDNGINLENRAQVRKVINDLIDPNDAAHLRDKGYEELNQYSAGGADILNRWFAQSPRSPLFFATALINEIRKQNE
ncbi:hypothetical protein H8D29_03380 [PVC group bacterium]|nr:hypothetical protein [PVC group bacterium]